MTDTQYTPGFYVKGDVTKVARSKSAAVALVFDGFRLRTSEDTDYRTLQRQAKEAGISPKQSAAALTAALNALGGEQGGSEESALGVPPETGGDSPLEHTEVETDDESALDQTSTDTDEN